MENSQCRFKGYEPFTDDAVRAFPDDEVEK